MLLLRGIILARPPLSRQSNLVLRFRCPPQFQLGAFQPGRFRLQDASTFQYTPLPHISPDTSHHHIRLLELLPGHSSLPISSILKEVSLSSDLSYEALSYCWGDLSDRTSIICNGQPLLVPKTLETALRNMRYSDTPRLLWADAICINQSDVLEREQQVKLMRSIYSKAQRTLIWLGDASEKNSQDISWFAQLSLKIGLAVLRRRVDLNQSPQVRILNVDGRLDRISAPFDAEFYLELVRMLRMPWFQRAWVVQEVVVSSRATIFWGSSQYDWEELTRALRFMSQQEFPLVFIVTLQHISTIEEERKLYQRGGNSTYGVLLRHQRCIATEQRDKVYSFCGLFESSSAVRISYRDDLAVVYREVAIQILHQNRSLDILSRPPGSAKSSIKDLPSWVPDWSICPKPTFTYSWGHGTLSLAGTEATDAGQNSRFCTTLNSTYSPKILSQQNVLELEGYLFDTVVEVGPIFEGVQVPNSVRTAVSIARDWMKCGSTLLHARKVFIAWQRLANVHSKDPYITNESIHEAFWQTVSTGELHSSPRVAIELNLWEKGSRFPFGLLHSAFTIATHFFMNKPFMLFEIQARCSLGRTMVRLRRGGLGLAAGETRVGDSVVLCRGSSVPLILRKREDMRGMWRLIGDSYVHGIMKGEAWEENRCSRIVIV